jgi:hypothetical protein
VDDARPGRIRTTRLLGWATAGLLVAGAVSAGTVGARRTGDDVRIVSAAGNSTGRVDPAPSSTTLAPPFMPTQPTVVPPTTAEPPTTVPKPVITPATNPPVKAPVKAPATTTPTTAQPTTAQPPRTTTTAVTTAGRATVTIVSQYGYDVDVTLNGRVFRVAANATVGPIDLALAADGNDVVEVRVVSRPTCGEGDAGGYFVPGGTFRLTVAAAGTCQDIAGPAIRSTAA